jgi:DME family drug/metabolite transporter
VSGTLIAAASGIGFGLFQSVNVRAVRGLDPFVSTFVQLVIAAVALLGLCVATQDIGAVADAPWWVIMDFAVAGLLHFFVGWTLLNLSQQRVGAARTSPLLTTVPVFGVVIAAITLGQLPGPVGLAAIGLIVVGAWVTASRGEHGSGGWRDAAPGLLCAVVWALSPVFTMHGLDEFNEPLIGVTIGLLASVAGYALALPTRRGLDWNAARGEALGLKAIAGILVGVATWGRWAALDLQTVGVVLALSLVSVPIVLVVAPRMAGRHLENVTPRIWAGACLVIVGSLVLIVSA